MSEIETKRGDIEWNAMKLTMWVVKETKYQRLNQNDMETIGMH